MSEEKMLTTTEINTIIESLIEWFESKDIKPKNAACVMVKLIAQQMVGHTHDLEALRHGINITMNLLASEVATILKEEGFVTKGATHGRPV